MIELTKFEWDSTFWNTDIYNVESFQISSDFRCDFNKKISSNRYIIQALILDKDIELINFLEEHGFRFVESKINLIKRIQYVDTSFSTNLFRDVKLDEITQYKESLYELYGEVSRFSCFPKNKVIDFYYSWVVNSIKGKLDDNCIGYYLEEKLAGFITYKIVDKKLIIGLVGVFPKFQGRKISQELLQYVESIASEEKCNEICVSTQGKNIKAINAYIKSNFVIDSIKHWYYLKELT